MLNGILFFCVAFFAGYGLVDFASTCYEMYSTRAELKRREVKELTCSQNKLGKL